jgi:predicted HicB family RNase H-like nuclease
MKAKPKKEVIIQSSLRIPKPLWEAINRAASRQRLSMAQAVERALFDYCDAHDAWTVKKSDEKGGK